MSNRERQDRIERLLREAFAPQTLEVTDQSHRHAGHPGARDGRGHFDVTLVSSAFADRPLIERHRMIYAALGNMMKTDVHALSIRARTPEETE